MTNADDEPAAALVDELEALLLASHANRTVLRDLLVVVAERLEASRGGTSRG